MKLSIKLFIENNGKYIFGPGRAELLRAIDRLGSLSKAAQEQGMSYRWAWGRIKEAEKALGVRLLAPDTGSGKGNTKVLTAEARQLLEWFTSIEENMYDVAHQAKIKSFSLLSDSIHAAERSDQPPQKWLSPGSNSQQRA